MILVYRVKLLDGSYLETKNAAMACYHALANNTTVEVIHYYDKATLLKGNS